MKLSRFRLPHHIKRVAAVTSLTLMLCSGNELHSQPVVNHFLQNPVNDIALIYYGAEYRPAWTQDQISQAVVHKFADGHVDWFFPAFLYLEFGNVKYGYITDVAQPADKVQWQWLIDRQFIRGQSFDALDKAIAAAMRQLGEPPFRHKLVICIPTPILGQTNWGSINGHKLNFNNTSHRLEAVKWYIDLLLETYYKQGYTNFDLEGLYWTEEDTRKTADILPAISQYVHQKGLKFYWIPFLTAKGRDDWQKWGFDYAYIQPNYTINARWTTSRNYEAITAAKRYGMGLEFEFDEKLHEKRAQFGPRFDSLIDIYTQEGIFKDVPIAYYMGTKELLDLNKSNETIDHQRLDRIATLVGERNRRLNGTLPKKASEQKTSATQTSDTPNGPAPDKGNKGKNPYNDDGSLNPDYWHF